MDLLRINKNRSLIDIFTDLGMKPQIDKMIIFDYLIKNIDRHEYNFGILRDSNSLEITDFAPLYDSGSCLNFSYNPETKDMGECKPFRATWDKQLSLVDNVVNIPDEKWIANTIEEIYGEAKIQDKYVEIAKTELTERINQINLINEKNKTKDMVIEDGYDRT